MEKIMLYYIDDHPVARSGFKTMFRASRDSINIAGEADSVEKAIEDGKHVKFDIILLDLWLKTGDPIDNFDKIKAAFPDHPIVIYTGDKTTYWQRNMYKAGAAGYIDKELGKDEIRTILEEIKNGARKFYFTAENDVKKIHDLYRDSIYKLNNTEQNILKYLVDGFVASEIASILRFDISTIDKALRSIRKKFNVKNNIELVKAVLSSF